MEEAIVLRERFSRETEALINLTFGPRGAQVNHQDYSRSLSIGLRMIRVLSKRNPRWLLNNSQIVDRVYDLWNKKFTRPDEDTLTYMVK